MTGVDFSGKLLGKNPAKHDSRIPMLMSLPETFDLPPAPPEQNWYSAIAEWPMDANDTEADCTSAAVAHAIQQWTVYAQGMSVIMDTAAVLALYGQTKDPNGEGAYLTDVLAFWLNNGVETGYGKHNITAFAKIAPGNIEHSKCGIAWFGNLVLGVALPLSAQDQEMWTVVSGAASGAGSWGGHAILAAGYSSAGIYFVSWGRLMLMTWEFYQTYCDEAYVVLTRDFMKPPGNNPAGVSWADLANRMKALKS